MLQLVYISTAVQAGEIAAILGVSRANNARDGITGLLYADGVRFLQALEGVPDRVEATFERIRRDDRHRAIVVLSRRMVDAREFGAWDMAHRTPADRDDAFLVRLAPLIERAAPSVRGTFEGFAKVRRAAA